MLHVEIVLPATVVGTELDRSGHTSHSGFIDLIDTRTGVRGWAVNLADPTEPVRLQLCIGGRTVAETLATGERPDISAGLGVKAQAAFHFDAAAMQALGDFIDDPGDVLSVRLAATGQYLSYKNRPVTGADILAHAAPEAPPPSARHGSAELHLLLDELQAHAGSLTTQALRPLPEALQGYIETVALTSSGQVWFMGWMQRGHLQEFSAVVVEQRKYPAAVAVMSYLRDDLPAEACGVVGVIATSWRPNSASRDVHLFFGGDGRYFMKSHDPLRLLPSGELAAEYEGVRDRCLGDGRAIALQRALASLESWQPSRTETQWFGTETSIDRVLVVPGLGCFVEGWVISPIKRVETLRLRVGAAILSAHPDSLYWKPRRDLLAAFPGSERLAERAGFVGLFTGEAEPDDFADPVLKVVFEGGSSANWPVAARAFRRLGHSASVEDALMFFPALQEETFFPRFALAAIEAERGAMAAPVPITVARSRRAMVWVLPEDRCDLFLLFEDIAQQVRGGMPMEALAFVAAARSNRSDALWLFREFQAAYGTPRNIACSLLVIDDAAQGFSLLPDILREIGASRFFFAGHGTFLTGQGWAQVGQALASSTAELVFFGLETEEFERRDPGEEVSARCFAWSAGAFARWALSAPAFMGGFYRDNALGRAGGLRTVHGNAARSTRARLPTRTEEAVNAAVYASAVAHAPVRLQGAA